MRHARAAREVTTREVDPVTEEGQGPQQTDMAARGEHIVEPLAGGRIRNGFGLGLQLETDALDLGQQFRW
jgi:hypothetical protein